MYLQKFLPIITVGAVAVIVFTQRLWMRSPSPQAPVQQQGFKTPSERSRQGIQNPAIPDGDKLYLPNPKLTPGSIFTQATRQDICVPGYTRRVRHVPPDVKRSVYRSYGIRHHQPGEYEVDHLISLELGGDNQPTNLWPEPYQGPWNAHIKDDLEDELHRRVCAGTVPLQVAQREISSNWVAAYRKYVGGQ